MSDAYANVVVMLTASSGGNIVVRDSRIEIASFDSRTPARPKPYIQTDPKLDDAGIRTGRTRVYAVERQG